MIFIDLTAYSPNYLGGVSAYVRGLVGGFSQIENSKEIILLTAEPTPVENFKSKNNQITIIQIKIRFPRITRYLHVFNYRLVKSQRFLAIIQKVSHADAIKIINKFPGVVYCPTTYANFPLKDLKYVVSLHDIQEKHYPEFFSRSQRTYRDLNVKNTLKWASHIQISSHFVGEEIRKYYKLESKKCEFEIISEGVSIKSANSELSIPIKRPSNMVILPASFHQHKNQVILLDALKELDNSFDFYLTGDSTMHVRGREFQELARNNHVRLLGYINAKQLQEFYDEAFIVLSTSLYESSSLPLLEGIASGCIPVASDIPAHREMAESFEIFLFDPLNPRDLVLTFKKIAQLSEENVERIIQNNLETINQYKWNAIARKYLGLFSVS